MRKQIVVKKRVPRKFIAQVKALGYVNREAKEGIDMAAFGAEFGVGYHGVRLWFNGTNPVPKYARQFVERAIAAKA